MEFGGIILALSALLWLAYLLPTWLRRRQYLATEKNAVRLQQTLRILAETAEVPDAVRAETSARSVAEQQRALRRAAEEAEAASRARDAAAERALPKVTARTAASPTAAVRLRRARLTTTLILTGALITMVVGISRISAGGSWTVLVVGSIVGMLAVLALQRMARVAHARRRIVQAPRRTVTRTSFTDFAEPGDVAPSVEQEAAPWTPVPVPKPLYLSRTALPVSSDALEAAVARATAEQELRDAAARADRALRETQGESGADAVEATPAEAEAPAVSRPTAVPAAEAETPAAAPADSAPAAPAAPQSRFARMGIVEDAEPGMADLDAVLRRRRAAG
ncbi:hypothetical protein [Planctomonas psychrotolerans]|uniref:hypothetical protein n=1 Tax=Planctomonas psychrotolerans TaxID=2528712 RepID=UPI001239184F|nr:hypothetical protein [Planctomonas psychrotolerans]